MGSALRVRVCEMPNYIRLDIDATDRYRTVVRFPNVAPVHMPDPEKEIADEKRRQLHIDRIAWKAEAARQRKPGVRCK